DLAARDEVAALPGFGVLHQRDGIAQRVENVVAVNHIVIVANDVVQLAAREPRAKDDEQQDQDEPEGELFLGTVAGHIPTCDCSPTAAPGTAGSPWAAGHGRSST